ncbi:MAG: PEP-CTERM sorting domain-containing protein [Rubrivivax sp.]|nr:MAG: PEP-CTERM sorting domain-containing protein [Rubrivivax sp.]
MNNTNDLQVFGQFDNPGLFQNDGTLLNHGQITSSGELVNTSRIENRGSVSITGSFTHRGEVLNSGGFTFAAGSTTHGLGSYLQTAGTTRLDGTVTLAQFALDGGSLCGTGHLYASVHVGGSASICAAGGPSVNMLRAGARSQQLAAADVPVSLTIDGDLVLDGGTLSFDIGGLSPGSFGSLVIVGHVLGTRGTLQLNFIDGYQPALGDSWTLLGSQDAAPLSGFTLQVAGLPSGYAFSASDSGGIGVSAVPAPVPEPGTLLLLPAGLVMLARRRLLAALCCALPMLASATTVVGAGAWVGAGNIGVPPVSGGQENAAHASVTLAQSNDSTEAWTRHASAYANARVGTLGLTLNAGYAHSAGKAYPPSGYTSANADATWSETLTIGTPSATGLGAAHWSGVIELTGTVATNATGAQAAFADVVVYATGLLPPPDLISGDCDSGRAVACISAGGPSDKREGPWLLPIDVHFVPGKPFVFEVSLRGLTGLYVSSCDDCALDADVNFGHTLRWLGTTAVTDDDGHVLTDYTLTSESGFDYRLAAPVPEPGRLWLTALGVLALAWRHLRGSQAAPPRRALALLLAVCASTASAARDEEADLAARQPQAATERPAPGTAGRPLSLAYAYARRDTLVSAAAGDSELVFVTQPLAASVAVLDRFTGRQLGELPPPPGGWLLPFSLRVPRDGHVVVLDSGGLPSPTAPAVPRVYDYSVFYNPHTLRLHATLTRIVRFDGLPVVFAEDVEVAANGHYVVSESIIGALWVIKPDGSIAPGLFPSGGQPIPQLAPCAFTPATVGGLPFTTAGNFAPGVVGLAERAGQLYFSTTCNGGVYRVPMASLTDATRSPAARALDIRPASLRAPGTASESLHGLAFSRAHPGDGALYAADSLQLRIVRIDTRDGSRQVVASDPTLFNFPSKLQFLPPVNGLAPLLVASDQEHRLMSINAALQADQLQPPWIITKVLVGPPYGPHHTAVRPTP